jgi:BirA family biotin operon repressor/biotin-[acetyl-CoA-carboxylase] ligase
MTNPTEQILSFLYKNKDVYTSGQAMANELSVTRAAIWKCIEALRGDGYEIESAAAKGYRLASVPDLLGEREIRLGLDTKYLGCEIHSLAEVDSTNSYASKLAAAGAPEGTVVVSEHQTAGRGRLGRKWVSPPGVNIYVSVILRPEVPPSDAPMVTLAASVPLTRAIKAYGLPAAIKWPNDVLINGRKAAGILTEMSAEPDLVRHIVLGVGIDVNMQKGAFPKELKETATSMMMELGGRVDRAGLLRRFLSELEGAYGMFTRGEKEAVLNGWRELSCTLGRDVKVSTPSGETKGRALDLDASGGLMVELEGGRVETLTSGDVGFV